MKKLVTIQFILSIVMFQTAPSVYAGNPYGFAVGGGDNAAGEHFSFSAHDGSEGPSGHVRIENSSFILQGPVTCYSNDAPNAARFGIEIKKASGTVPPGFRGFVFAVIDNDNPGSAGPDYLGTGFTIDPPIVCPPQIAGTPLVSGNITVKNP